MTIEQHALLEIPVWLVIALTLLGGLSGEMWRADKEGARGWSLVRRLSLRSGSSMSRPSISCFQVRPGPGGGP